MCSIELFSPGLNKSSLSTGHHPDRAHASRKRTDAGGDPAGAPHGHGTRMERSAASRRDTARSPGELSGTRHPPVPRWHDPRLLALHPRRDGELGRQRKALDPSRAVFPEALAALHCRFERIHPFLDGNGRTGRLILNLILVRHGYPPAIIYKRDRARYLRALQRADTGDASALGEMLARAILDSLHRFVIPAVADPDRLVPLAALETPGMKASALRASADRGRLRATRGSDGQWRSSRKCVEEYLASRYRRGETTPGTD